MLVNKKNSIALCKNCKKESGYTLIQMAIALVVLGVLMAAFLSVYSLYNQTEKVTITQENVSTAVQKLQAYRQSYGAYPCPAPMNVARDSPNPPIIYGKASSYGRYLVATGAVPLAAGRCAEGVCIESNIRNDLAGNPEIRVRVGAIPFRDMQMDESETFDGYGSKLWYAVTEDMCNLSTLNDSLGGINIVNDLGETQTNPPKSAGFMIISPGKNKVGGYSKYGTQQSACTVTADAENCRDMSVATQTDPSSKYLVKFTVDATTTPGNIYDDVTEYFSASANQLWRRMSPTSENILDVGSGNKVAIGPAVPAAELDISQTGVNSTSGIMTTKNTGTAENGALRVNGGSLWATQYCSENGTNCFHPEDITGDKTAATGGIKCPANTYPVGIKSSGDHADFDCVSDISIKCPPNQALRGFTISGTTLVPNCTASAFYASCPAGRATLCSAGDVTLGSASHGNYSDIVYAGDCRGGQFLCQDGTWVAAWEFGQCTAQVTVTPGLACGDCWSGTYTQISNSCAGTTDTRAIDCKCTTCSTIRSGACPASAPDGTPPTIKYNYACNAANPFEAAHIIAPLSGTPDSAGTCSCNKVSYNNFVNCSGSQIRRDTAPPVVPLADSRYNSWPTSTKQGKYTPMTVNSANCSWITGTPVDQCACNTADIYSKATPSPPTCKVAKSGSRVVNGTSYAYSYDVLKSVNTNATTCSFSPATVVDSAQFVDKPLFWREIGGSLSGNNKERDSNYPIINEKCTCASDGEGSTKGCQRANSVGKFDNYLCGCNP